MLLLSAIDRCAKANTPADLKKVIATYISIHNCLLYEHADEIAFLYLSEYNDIGVFDLRAQFKMNYMKATQVMNDLRRFAQFKN